MKSTWIIINKEKGKTQQGTDVQSLVIKSNEITDQNKITNTFNNCFLSIADLMNTNYNNHINTHKTNPINYLLNSFKRTFIKMSWQCDTTYEIEKLLNHYSLYP
jgi:hypothetical protein